jgi:hypothetical protein
MSRHRAHLHVARGAGYAGVDVPRLIGPSLLARPRRAAKAGLRGRARSALRCTDSWLARVLIFIMEAG